MITKIHRNYLNLFVRNHADSETLLIKCNRPSRQKKVLERLLLYGYINFTQTEEFKIFEIQLTKDNTTIKYASDRIFESRLSENAEKVFYEVSGSLETKLIPTEAQRVVDFLVYSSSDVQVHLKGSKAWIRQIKEGFADYYIQRLENIKLKYARKQWHSWGTEHPMVRFR